MILKSRKHFIVMGEGRGCEEGGGLVAGNSRLPHLAIPDLTSSFLDFRPFIFFFRLQNIDHCCVISPISNTINGLILEIRESTVGYLWFRLRRGGGGGGGGGGEAWGTWCRGPSLPPPHLAFLAPFFLH